MLAEGFTVAWERQLVFADSINYLAAYTRRQRAVGSGAASRSGPCYLAAVLVWSARCGGVEGHAQQRMDHLGFSMGWAHRA